MPFMAVSVPVGRRWCQSQLRKPVISNPYWIFTSNRPTVNLRTVCLMEGDTSMIRSTLMVDVVEGMRVLCLGTGAPAIAAQLTQRGAGVVSLWWSKDVRTAFQQLPLIEGAVAAVVASCYLGAWPHPEAALEDCCRLLAGYGRLVLIETMRSDRVYKRLEQWMAAALSNVIVGRAQGSGAWMATGTLPGMAPRRWFSETFRRRGRFLMAGNRGRSHGAPMTSAVPGARSPARSGACGLR